MTPEQLGRRSLIADAVYCAVGGALGLIFRRRLSKILEVPRSVTFAVSGGTVIWAGVVGQFATWGNWRKATATIAYANGATAIALVAIAKVHPHPLAKLILAGTAIEVAAFGAVQAVAVFKPDAKPIEAAPAEPATP